MDLKLLYKQVNKFFKNISEVWTMPVPSLRNLAIQNLLETDFLTRGQLVDHLKYLPKTLLDELIADMDYELWDALMMYAIIF